MGGTCSTETDDDELYEHTPSRYTRQWSSEAGEIFHPKAGGCIGPFQYEINCTEDYYNDDRPEKSHYTPSYRSSHALKYPTGMLFHPKSGGCIGPFDCALENDLEDEELVSGSNVHNNIKPQARNSINSPNSVMEFPVSIELVLNEIITRHLIARPYDPVSEYLYPIHLIDQAIALNQGPASAKDRISCDTTLKMGNAKANSLRKQKIREKLQNDPYNEQVWGYNDSSEDWSRSSDTDPRSFVKQAHMSTGTNFFQISLKSVIAESYETFIRRYPHLSQQTGLFDQWSHSRIKRRGKESKSSHSESRSVLTTINESPFMDLMVSGSLGLLSVVDYASARKRKPVLVVSNKKTGEILTVSAFRRQGAEARVRIFATRPRALGQKAACTTRQIGLDHDNASFVRNAELFQWADIVSDGPTFPDDGVKYFIYMATGLMEGQVDQNPKYTATYASVGSPELVMFSRPSDKSRNRIGTMEPCAVVMLKADERKGNSQRSDQLGTSFVMNIAKGIDPVIITTITAVIEEVTGYFIQQCLN